MKKLILFKFSAKRGLLFLAAGLFLSANFSTIAQTIPADRLPAGGSWQGIVGIPGGIPNRTNIFVNVLTTSNPSYKVTPGVECHTQIQNAVAACPSNEVVYLPAGVYIFNTSVNLNYTGVTVRGDGQGKTIVTNSAGNVNFVCDPPSSEPWEAGAWPAAMTLASDAAKGATSITVASTNNVYPGMMLWLTQNNDGVAVFGNGEANTFGPNLNGPPGVMTVNNAFNFRVLVTSMNGNTINFTPPLYIGLHTSQGAAAYAVKGPYGSASTGVMSGLEDLTSSGSISGKGIDLQYARNFWVKDVEFYHYDTFCLQLTGCLQCEIRECYIHEPAAFNRNYGYSLVATCDNNCLLADNIIWRNETGFDLENSVGNALCYNFFFDGWNLYSGYGPNAGEQMLYGNHCVYTAFNIWEGNCGSGYKEDFYYGPGGYNMVFRNYLTGTDPTTLNDRFCINIDAHQWSNSVVGNILGSTCVFPPMFAVMPGITFTWTNTQTQSWVYDIGINNASYTSNVVFRLGYADSGDNGSSGTESDGGSSCLGCIDMTVKTNTLIAANWDIYNKAVVNPMTVQASLIYSSKPSWWDNVSPWPPYEATNATAATLTNLPAAKRFFFGSNYSTNGVSGNQAPVVVATANPVSGSPSLTVTFSSVGSYDPEGVALTYNWTFGDGTTSTAANPTHSYSSSGIYSAQLSVSDGVNTSTSGTITISVLPIVTGLQTF
jgi:hypothetical protein